MSLTQRDFNRASTILLYLKSVMNDPANYVWMSDLLFMMDVPEAAILREAGSRNGAWHRRIRKTSESIFLKQAKALAEELDDAKQFAERNGGDRQRWKAKQPVPDTLVGASCRWPRPQHEDPVADDMLVRRLGRQRKRKLGEAFETIRPTHLKRNRKKPDPATSE